MINSTCFEFSCRLLQRRANRIDTKAFRPLVCAVLRRYPGEVLLIATNQSPEGNIRDWSFPAVPLGRDHKINDAFSQLVTRQLGVESYFIETVAAVNTGEFDPVGESDQDGRMNFYIPLLGTVAGRPSVQLEPSIGVCAEWYPVNTVPEILAAHSSIPEKDAALAILDGLMTPK